MNQRKNLILFVATFFLGAALLLFVTSMRRDNPIDNAPYEGENPNTASRVILSNESALFNLVKEVHTLDRISSELYVFGKTAFSVYSNDKQPMGFRIDDVSQENNKVLINGKYGQSKHKIAITFIELNNSHVSISITDTDSGLNIDQYLESNQSKNQLIGNLPIEETTFTLRYIEDSDTFAINAFIVSGYTDAENIIRSYLDDEEYSNQKIVRYGAGNNNFERLF